MCYRFPKFPMPKPNKKKKANINHSIKSKHVVRMANMNWKKERKRKHDLIWCCLRQLISLRKIKYKMKNKINNIN